MRSVICTIVKNEQLFIREWILWHIDAGFDHLYIYEDYGSNSHRNEIADLIDCGKVSLVNLEESDLPIPKHGIRNGNSTQMELFKWFLKCCRDGKIEADWIGFFDVDEFIEFEEGYDLEKIEKEYEDKGGILLSWVLYGANGHIKRPLGNVVDNYKNHLPLGEYFEKTTQASSKSLVNVKNCEGLYNIHAFRGCERPDGSDRYSPLCFKKAWINHYFTKSWEDYLDRTFARGNMKNNHRHLDLFFKINKEFAPFEKQMIEELRYRLPNGTMWISKKYYIIAGGNLKYIEQLKANKYGKL